MSVRSVRIVFATVLGIAGIALGVYGDWILWHPMDGLLLTLATISDGPRSAMQRYRSS